MGRGPAPAEMEVVVMSERVGGYLAYLELDRNARHYDLFAIAMAGEHEAARIRSLTGGRNGK